VTDPSARWQLNAAEPSVFFLMRMMRSVIEQAAAA